MSGLVPTFPVNALIRTYTSPRPLLVSAFIVQLTNSNGEEMPTLSYGPANMVTLLRGL
jgi:hypothetical protein